jgi:hypothetical protein
MEKLDIGVIPGLYFNPYLAAAPTVNRNILWSWFFLELCVHSTPTSE